MIETKSISKSFKDVKAVRGVDLKINQGEFVALLGPNGAGKTTLVEMIEGIQQPDSGEVSINGKTWKGNNDELHRILGISLQDTRFIDKLRVIETLRLFASFYNLGEDRVQSIIGLTGLEEKRRSYVVNLSGGQRQKLALGIALLNEPEILLLDEPTTGLDPTARREIWDLLLNLKKSHKVTMILTTHYMDEAAYLCERIVIMDHGKILAQGCLDELLSSESSYEIIEFRLKESCESIPFSEIEGILDSEWDPALRTGRIHVPDNVTFLPLILSFFDTNNYHLERIDCRKMTLEDLFLLLTGRKLHS